MNELPPAPPIPTAAKPTVPENNRTHAVMQRARAKANKAKEYDSPYGKSNGQLMTANQITEIFGITPYKLNKLREMGMNVLPLPGSKEVRYHSGVVLKFIHDVEVAKVQSVLDNVLPEIDHAQEMAEASRRKAVAEAMLAELKVANEQGLVANIDDLMDNFSEAITNVRGALMSFRARLPGQLAHSSEEEVATILDAEVKQTLNALVEYNHEYKESL